MSDLNNQLGFNFLNTSHQKEQQEINDIIERHNRQFSVSSPQKFFGITFLDALNEAEVRQNAVYMLRGLLSSQLKKAIPNPEDRRLFLRMLIQEIKLKKMGTDPVNLVRSAIFAK
jgi:hypothetical protein